MISNEDYEMFQGFYDELKKVNSKIFELETLLNFYNCNICECYELINVLQNKIK